MFGIFDKLTEFFKDMLLGGIKANLESMFLDINDKVGVIATDVGKTPMGWNGEVYNFIKNINDNVIVPIAGLIITAVLCIELINMVMQKNNMHDTDTFEFFKYIIKMFIAVYLASHAFEFSMAVFDVAQNLVNKAAGVITTSATVSGDQIVAMVDTLKEKEIEEVYIEADEDHVATQTKGNKEIKLISVYEGKEKESKKRRKTIKKRSFTGTMDPEEIWYDVLDYLDQAYDIDKVKTIYIGGDGASWIKTGIKIIPKSKYIIDSYHLSKYIKLITDRYLLETGDILEIEKLEEAIKTTNHHQYKEALKNMEESTETTLQLTNAYKYLRNQWQGIKNKIKNPEIKISAEGQVSHILSSRLSSRPLGWSEEGMDKMSRMRVYQDNGGDLEKYYLKKRKEKHKETRIIKLDEKVSKPKKSSYNNNYGGTNIEILNKSSGKWLKQWLNTDFLKSL